MSRYDVKWLFRLLSTLTQPRLLLLAGCVTKKKYINHFLKQRAPDYGFHLLGEAQPSGRGRVGYHAFKQTNKLIAGFFCSVSPSANDKDMLAQRIKEHKNQLEKIIKGEHLGWVSNRYMQLTALEKIDNTQRY